jgi:putative heme-binding domain-containing protein
MPCLRFVCIALLSFTLLTAVSAQEGATPVERLNLLPGFEAELLYSVPGEEQGSWVSMTADEQGRLIVSDQYGRLYRVTPPALGEAGEAQVELIDVEIGMAQGLLWAFDSLYVMVNPASIERGQPPPYEPGLYRVTDSNGDGELDTVTQLRRLNGGGEHGPHAIILAPDGQSLFVCAGNHTDPTEFQSSRVPRNWAEDVLHNRQWDARGHAAGRLAPAGWIAKVSPDGSDWELFSNGFRNEYDIAFSPEGELFTYDADMEWDVGTPWYRPTRVNHVTSGAEFGWRSGTGKWPEFYPDSLPAVVDIGTGSPTGIVFGTGAKFPEKYQRALFIADWSYGIIYAVHLTPQGSSYTGETERFVSAQPLPVTDMIVNPADGAFYFAIGGRRTQSGLYRVTYTGEESTAPAESVRDEGTQARAVRSRIEQLHGVVEPSVVDAVWDGLSLDDRHIRFAARIAIEHQPVETWADRVLAERHPIALIHGAIALARCGEESHADPLVAALDRIEWNRLSASQQLDLVRAYGLIHLRLGEEVGYAETEAAESNRRRREGPQDPARILHELSEQSRQRIIAKVNDAFPARSRELNRELAALLIAVRAPGIAERTVALLETAPTQEDQIHYALVLKDLKEGWTPELRRRYFHWFADAAAHRGGMSFGGFLDNIRKEAVASLSKEELAAVQDILDQKPEPVDPLAQLKPRPLVKEWTVADLESTADERLHGRDFENGRRLFSMAACFRCHRVRGEGGMVGPDLTGAGGRFNNRDLLEAMIEPNKVISDQYQQTQFLLEDGRLIEGRVINLNGDNLMVLTDMFDPSRLENINRKTVEQMQPSPNSMMPEGLLNTFNEEDILDLMAFLRAGGNPDHEVFRKK